MDRLKVDFLVNPCTGSQISTRLPDGKACARPTPYCVQTGIWNAVAASAFTGPPPPQLLSLKPGGMFQPKVWWHEVSPGRKSPSIC